MTLPNFLIIGAQRAGSTWLYRGLRSHPSVFLADPKEPEFFSYRSPLAKGLSWYERTYFSDVGPARAIGEATPSYLWASSRYSRWDSRPDNFNKQIPRDIRDALGEDMRFIVTLRDPVDRAVSAYLHHIRLGRLSLSDSILEVGSQAGIVHMGFYGAHLSEWFKEYERDRFLIVLLEYSVHNPNETYAKLCRHVGVEERSPPDEFRTAANRGAFHVRRKEGRYEVRRDDGDSWQIAVTAGEANWLRAVYEDDRRELQQSLLVNLAEWWPAD